MSTEGDLFEWYVAKIEENLQTREPRFWNLLERYAKKLDISTRAALLSLMIKAKSDDLLHQSYLLEASVGR